MKKRIKFSSIICFALSLFLLLDNANQKKYKPVLAQDQTVYLSEVMTFEAENADIARTDCISKGFTFVNKK